MKPFIRSKKFSMTMDIAPLIDIIFMLLLFFMITTSFSSPSIPLKMPDAANKQQSKDKKVIISIDKDNNIYLNRQKVELNELEELLERKIEHSQVKIVVFKADENILYKYFVAVLDIVKRSGAQEINISHELKENN